MRDQSAPIVVESLSYPVVGMLPRSRAHEDDGEKSIVDDLMAAPEKSRDELKQKRDEVGKELLGLKRAVWLLAAAIVLAAMIV